MVLRTPDRFASGFSVVGALLLWHAQQEGGGRTQNQVPVPAVQADEKVEDDVDIYIEREAKGRYAPRLPNVV